MLAFLRIYKRDEQNPNPETKKDGFSEFPFLYVVLFSYEYDVEEEEGSKTAREEKERKHRKGKKIHASAPT